MTNKTITVDGGKYELPSQEECGIIAGYVLDDIAARHLYQARCENIRSNITGPVKKMKASGASHDEIAAYVLQYGKDYKFSVAGGRTDGGAAQGAKELDEMRYTIANEYVEKFLADQGRKITDIPSGLDQDDWNTKLRTNIRKVADHPDTIKLAKRRLAAARRTAKSVLSGVSL